MRHLFFLLCCLGGIGSSILSAQQAQIDSVKQLLASNIHDTIRADALNKLSFYYYYSKPDTSLSLANEAMALSRSIGFDRGIAKAHYQRGLALVAKGENGEAILELKTSLELSLAGGFTQYEQFNRNVLGILYTNIGAYQEATEQLEASMRISERLGDPIGVATACANLSKIFLVDNDEDSARPYLRRAAQLLEENGALTQLSTVLVNLSAVVESREEEEEILRRAINLAQEQGNNYTLLLAYGNYAALLNEYLDQPQLARDYYLRALAISSDFGDPYQQTHLEHDYGIYLMDHGILDSARFYLERSLERTEEGLFPEKRQVILLDLSSLNQASGQANLAANQLREALELADTVRNRDRVELLANADARYQLSQKEATIAAGELEIAQRRSAQSRQLLYGLAIFAILIAGFQYFFYRQRRRKREVELALEQEQAEGERLRELDELKSQFFTNVSHELRTPLTLITSPLEEALKELRQHKLENKLQLAYRNARQLLGLTNEILDLAKLEAGQLQLVQEDVVVLPRVSRLLAAFQSQAEIKNIELRLEADGFPEDYRFHTAPKELDTIVNNLLANALKFTPSGGTVTLQLEQAQTNIQISVIDSGPGIAPRELDRIFDRFYQSSQTTNPEGGSGIGLALSRQLAELMGGSLTVSSPPQQGSTFQLSLPAKPAVGTAKDQLNELTVPTIQAATTKQGATAELAPQVGTSILIVEDHPDMSAYLLENLQGEYHCEHAQNGRKALERLQEKRFDLILSDVMMPEMDGFAFRAAVNEWEAYRHIPFILLTARNLEADVLRGFQLGVDDYITKPFSLPELKARMASLLRNKATRENEWSTETIQDADQAMLDQAQTYVENHLDDPDLSVEKLAQEMNYSTRQLSRLFGSLTGLSPVQFILEIRLQTARRMLESKSYPTVAEVRYAVGIDSASYFSKKFKERFGIAAGGILKG